MRLVLAVSIALCVAYGFELRDRSRIAGEQQLGQDGHLRLARLNRQTRASRVANLLLALSPVAHTRFTAPVAPHRAVEAPIHWQGDRRLFTPFHSQRLNPHRRVSKPQMLFDRFNEDAIKLVMSAQGLVKELKWNTTSTDMLLYGYVTTSRSSARTKLLEKYKITADRVQEAIKQRRGVGEYKIESPAFSKRSNKALTASLEIAQAQGPPVVVECIHILLAILQDESCSAAGILKDFGINLQAMQKDIKDSMAEDKKSTVGAGGASSETNKAVTLEQYSTDLTERAKAGKLDPVVGREEEIERAILVLARRRKNNPVLLGDPGVGKTAIAEGIAQLIADGKAPKYIKDKRVVQLDVAGLLAGTKYRGDFEERLTNIIKEVTAAEGKIILMIDEIHTVVGAGGNVEGGGAMDAGNILKPKLASGEVQVIGATTRDEYRKYIEKDKALERRFQPIDVPEPSLEETIEILKGIVYKYENHHGLTYTPEAIEACATLADKYIADRFLPDKAIDVLDESGSLVKVMNDPWMQEVEQSKAQIELDEVLREKEQAAKAEDYERCEALKAKQEKLEAIVMKEMEGETEKIYVVSEVNVSSVVAKFTGIPVERVANDESERLLKLDDTLHDRVIGQDEAVTAVCKAVRRARTGLKDPNRPIASFIFAGPTGVGKTELCKALSSSVFGSEKAMIRFDMSEFMEKFSTSKLIGSPPGYVGYDDETQLTDRIRRNPYSLILFDEIEKAHPDVFNIMLQILEDGRLTDSKGRVVSFKNALIIMTSNIGAQNIEKTIEGGGGFGFNVATESAENATYEELKKVLGDEMKNRFRPEFINRLDDTIVFKPLTKDDVKKIAELEFEKVFVRVREQYNTTTIELTEKFKEKVLEQGFDPKFGARPLRREITKLLEDELSNSVLNDPFVDGEFVVMDVDDDGNVEVKRPTLAIKKNLDSASFGSTERV